VSSASAYENSFRRLPDLARIHRLNSRASSTPATDGRFIYVSFLEPDGSTVAAEVIRKRSGDLRADAAGKPLSPGGRRAWWPACAPRASNNGGGIIKERLAS